MQHIVVLEMKLSSWKPRLNGAHLFRNNSLNGEMQHNIQFKRNVTLLNFEMSQGCNEVKINLSRCWQYQHQDK